MEDRGRIWVRATGARGRRLRIHAGPHGRARARHGRARARGASHDDAGARRGRRRRRPGRREHTASCACSSRTRASASASQAEIAEDLRVLQKRFTGARVNITQEASIGERRANRDRRAIRRAGRRPAPCSKKRCPGFWRRRASIDVFTFVDSDLKFSKPEVRVDTRSRQGAGARRQRARHRADPAGVALSGQRFGYFIHDGKQYDVIGQLTRDFRSRPDDLGNIAVRSARRRRHGPARQSRHARGEQLAAGAVSLQPLLGRHGVRHAGAAAARWAKASPRSAK